MIPIIKLIIMFIIEVPTCLVYISALGLFTFLMHDRKVDIKFLACSCFINELILIVMNLFYNNSTAEAAILDSFGSGDINITFVLVISFIILNCAMIIKSILKLIKK